MSASSPQLGLYLLLVLISLTAFGSWIGLSLRKYQPPTIGELAGRLPTGFPRDLEEATRKAKYDASYTNLSSQPRVALSPVSCSRRCRDSISPEHSDDCPNRLAFAARQREIKNDVYEREHEAASADARITELYESMQHSGPIPNRQTEVDYAAWAASRIQSDNVEIARNVLRRRLTALNSVISALHAHGYTVVLTEAHLAKTDEHRILPQLSATLYAPGEEIRSKEGV